MAKLKSIIGCEISANKIRAVEIAKNDNKYSVVAMGYMPLQKGVVEEGFIRDADKFNASITELLSKGNFQSKDIAIAVNNENVLMRYAAFPKVDEDKLRNMVLLQAQEFIPIPIQEMEIDYVVAGESVDSDDIPQTNVMLIAARKQMLEGYINIFTASKLQVIDIDSSLLSYCRGINKICEGKKYAIVNLSDDVLNFIVVEGNEISMVRSISVPEKQMRAVTKVFNKDLNTVITDDNEETVLADEESQFEEELTYDDALNQVIGFLTSETSSTISYYSMQSNVPIEKTYFIMNAPDADKILSTLKDNLYMDMEIPDFYPEFKTDEIENMCEYSSCIGVAISSLEG